MIFRPLLAAAAIFLAGCQVSPVSAEPQEAPQWRLAIHGGAGVITRGSMTPEQEALYRAGLQEALEAGADVLRNGGSALDAVQAAAFKRALADDYASVAAAPGLVDVRQWCPPC